MLKFQVDSVAETGRNDALDIPQGTVFTKITRQRVNGDLMSLKTIELGEVAAVSLQIKAIEFYQQRSDVVPGGHTAALFLTGVGMDELASLLATKGDREFISLVACSVQRT